MSSKKSVSGIIISGTHTSVGKSSISMGLMRLLKNRGLDIRPFKVGPDYIDPAHHQKACGHPSYNLDSWMCAPDYVRELYRKVAGQGDFSVVEGVMGLYDGAHSQSNQGSTAEIALLTGLPVILVIDGSKMARSAAALVKGFLELEPGLKFLGVLVNRVNSPGHAKILREAIEYYTPARFLGNLPEESELEVSSRHLGLYSGHELDDTIYDKWASHLEKYTDIPEILNIETGQPSVPANLVSAGERSRLSPGKTFKVGVAKDEAFQFVYQDTLDLFADSGGNIQFFSPLKDKRLPENLDWIYIPGGYPELHAETLSSNGDLINELRKFAQSGKPMVAECGGLMYLGDQLINEDGKSFSMVGIFSFSTDISSKQLSIGYRDLGSPSGNSQDLKGIRLRGHEFHYSKFIDNAEEPLMVHVSESRGPEVRDGFRYKNCFAFYSHIYWASSLEGYQYILSLI